MRPGSDSSQVQVFRALGIALLDKAFEGVQRSMDGSESERSTFLVFWWGALFA